MSTMARQIAQVAARLFAARGYDATPVRAIAEAAGVTKPTLYYYFGSKEGLAQALLKVPIARLVETVRGLLDEAIDPVATIQGIVEAHFAFCAEDPDRARLFYAVFFGPLASGLAAELDKYGHELEAIEDEAGQRLARAGVIAPERVEAFVMALRGMIVIHTIQFLYRGGELGPELAHRIVADLLGGFGAADRD
ncbi:MAG: TetR/AcrR family transcriptional regulator, partial [Isosphaeraceae bacterium]|nr:TetR/AcrR family transcriptional regulator [Isosphaeraceae bacterium]